LISTLYGSLIFILIPQLRKPRNAKIALKYFFWIQITLFVIIGLLVYFKWFSAVTKFVSDRQSVNILPAPPTGTDKIANALKLTAPKSFFDEQRNLEGLKIDWHDYQQINEEKKRTGLGEGGKPGAVSAREKVLELDISLQNGFNGLLSDKISVNRSLPDLRHEE
jgi:polypeptide N-acetylgalactosaminyltransferase